MPVFLLGWRNLWRRPRRSLITVSAIGTAYAFLIVLIGLMEGLGDQLLNNGTGLLLGHVQIHHINYLPDRNIYDTLGEEAGTNSDLLLSKIRSLTGVQAASLRTYGFGLLSTGPRSLGVEMIGILPESEAEVSILLRGLVVGDHLLEAGAHRLILGELLAQELDAEFGTEVAVVTQAADGSLGNDLYHVSGILRTGLSHLDRSLALFHIADLMELLVLSPGQEHEIIVRIEDPTEADALRTRLNVSGFLPQNARAQSWADLSPQLKEYLSLASGMNRFIIILVAIFAAFGVLNTMMMAVFERTREIGLVHSLGMRPALILNAVLMESLYLLLLGLPGGLAIGSLLMLYLTTEGWDLSRWTGTLSMLNTRMDPVLKAVWAWDQVLWSAAGLAMATLLAAYLPARRAARMDAVEALRAPTED